MPSEFKMTHRVEFAETDMAGLVHFANYLRYMEVTEHAFFRTLGLSIAMEQKHGVGWPRVHASCDYLAPLRFEDEVEVTLKVREKKEKALTYDFLFRRVKPEPAVDVARGRITTVCVSREGGQMKAVPIPDFLARQIEVAPAGA
jgi:YbgC/YbaW family acyl-CoA thioester hydrolase